MSREKAALKRVIAIVIAVLMMSAAMISVLPLFVSAADEGTLSYPISDYSPGEDCYDPIPMLVIMISFDADGDGVDDNADGSAYSLVKQKVIDKKGDPMDGQPNPIYGEQWCHTTEEDWTSRLFSYEGNTLNSYYEYMSGGKFRWLPAQETYGEKDNGVIGVTLKNEVHPQCNGASANWVHCYGKIIEAASEYVDFSVFDKNGNGVIEKYELCFAFIIGGAETSSGQTNLWEVFGFHAYYKDYDLNNTFVTDGVDIGRSGFFATGAISGGHALNFGVFAHELGHYLGAPDLYDTGGTEYDLAVGSGSMMASGSHDPAHFDPYMLSRFGFYNAVPIAEDGEYTLYSKAHPEEEYNIYKICTPDPDEYFLIENRYSSITDGSAFDSGNPRGIIIWHIDERLHRRGGMTPNNSKDGNDPAVVAYTPLKSADAKGSPLTNYGGFMANNETFPYYAIFDPKSYTYPKSGTWYTSMTAEEAEVMKNLRIEVLSSLGDEMTIRVTGSYEQILPPEITLEAKDWTKNSVTIHGKLKTLNYSTLTEAKFTLTEKSTGTVVKTQDVVFNSDYTFEIPCDGLKPGTNYEFKVEGKSSNGDFTVADDNFTKPEEVKKVNITLVINSDQYGTTTQSVNVGNTHTIRVQPTKKGYTFDGWYLDEEYTKPYTAGVIEEEGDFTIYAKWTAKAPAATTPKPVQTTTGGVLPPPVQGGDNVQNPVNPAPIIIAVVAAVLVVGIIVAVVISKKKTPNGESKNK